MDIDSGAFQADVVFGATRRSIADSMQSSGGLTRYHSAPSALLASLLDDDLFAQEPSAFSQAQDSDFARFLCGELEPMPSLSIPRDMNGAGVPFNVNSVESQQHAGESRMIASQSQYTGVCAKPTSNARGGHLSAISEHGLEDSLDVFSSPQFPIPNSQVLAHSNPQSLPDMKPVVASGSNLSEAKTNLVRHNSSPADFLSRLVMEECSERPKPQFSGSYTSNLVEGMPERNTGQSNRLSALARPVQTVSGTNNTGIKCMGQANDARGGHLSAISEHGIEDSLDVFSSPQFPAPNSQLLPHSNHQSPPDMKPVVTSGSNLSEAKTNLIRHNSSPADILSRLAMEECSERAMPQFPGSYTSNRVETVPERHSGQSNSFPELVRPVQTVSGTNITGISCMGQANDGASLDSKMRTFGSPSGINRSGLLRQSSSPAGLLSQLAVDGLLVANEKTPISSSSGNSTEEGTFDRSAGTPVYANQATSVWDEVGMELAMEDDGAFGQRKRGRGLEVRIPQDMGVTTSLRSTAELNLSQVNHHNLAVGSSSGKLASIDRSFEDSVLCKIRAKRGCATHPRSIAERVRRMKISDGMRKLQELVPKLDKQINTADMLDEAVEYVKFLQRQVQELSENRCNCSGACHAKETAIPEA